MEQTCGDVFKTPLGRPMCHVGMPVLKSQFYSLVQLPANVLPVRQQMMAQWLDLFHPPGRLD